MDVTPVLGRTAKPLNGYGPGFFRVGDEVVNGAIFIQPEHVSTAPVAALADLTVDHITQLCNAQPRPEVLLIGVGAVFNTLPPKEWRAAARAAGVVLEPMDTGAACRTWNVLLAEGRAVAALLFPV